MSQNCQTSCSSCKDTGCSSATKRMKQRLESLENPKPARLVIGVMSGKGGVGKSLVTSRLAIQLTRLGLRVGILDGDITGPSIPRIFGLTERLEGEDGKIVPARTKTGIQVVSSNLMINDPAEPIAWRGPVITGALRQFYAKTKWDDLDVLLIDMPPGTSDVLLTVLQTMNLDGIISVSTPQDLVGMIVGKAIRLAGDFTIPILALVENMSYFRCSECSCAREIFGHSQLDAISQEFEIEHQARLGLEPAIAAAVDAHELESFDFESELDSVLDLIRGLVQEKKSQS